MNSFDPVSLVPMVIETTGRGEHAYDIFSLLLRNRIIFLGTPINDQISNLMIASFYISTRKTGKRQSRCTSTLQVARSMQAWRSMTQCR